MESLYTLKEVSNIIKIPVITLRKYLRDRELKGVKIGRHWRVTKEQLEEFIKTKSTGDERKNERK